MKRIFRLRTGGSGFRRIKLEWPSSSADYFKSCWGEQVGDRWELPLVRILPGQWELPDCVVEPRTRALVVRERTMSRLLAFVGEHEVLDLRVEDDPYRILNLLGTVDVFAHDLMRQPYVGPGSQLHFRIEAVPVGVIFRPEGLGPYFLYCADDDNAQSLGLVSDESRAALVGLSMEEVWNDVDGPVPDFISGAFRNRPTIEDLVARGRALGIEEDPAPEQFHSTHPPGQRSDSELVPEPENPGDDGSMDLDELTAIFTELGAHDPDSWATSEIRDGIAQLGRFAFLRAAWERILADSDTAWIQRRLERTPEGDDSPYAGVAHALRRLQEAGAEPADISEVVRGMQAELLFHLCYQLDDSSTDVDPTLVAWKLFEIDDNGNPNREIEALHESVLDTDPTGREMRPT